MNWKILILVVMITLCVLDHVLADGQGHGRDQGHGRIRRIRKRKLLHPRPKVQPKLDLPGVQDEILDDDDNGEELDTNAGSEDPPATFIPGGNRRFKVRRMKKKKKVPAAALNPHFAAPAEVASNPAVVVDETAKNRSTDDPRFLSLFTIVSFRNEPCTSGSGNNGTCYSQSDCNRLGGVGSGSCASGFGVCCLFTATCGTSTSTNCTYFQNQGYPSTFDSVGSCQLTVRKANSNICQLRLDFDNLVLAQPEPTDHQCLEDQFIVSGGSPVPAICGTNSGIHMYVDLGLASNSPAVLTAVTSGSSFSRSFSVRVCQIECNSLSKAPSGCVQYFQSVSGQVRSFNFQPGDVRASLQLSNQDYRICIRPEQSFCGIQYVACPDNAEVPNNQAPDGCLQYFQGINGQILSFNYNSAGGLMLSNTDYSVCIRMERSFCGIQYTACEDTVNTPAMSFSITGGNPTEGSIVGDDCQTDWITIPCATNSNDPNNQNGTPQVCVDRICGMVFNSVESDNDQPSVPVNNGDTQTQLDRRSQSFTLTGTFAPFGTPANDNYNGAGAVVGTSLGDANTPRPFCDTDWLEIPCVTNFQVGMQNPPPGQTGAIDGGCVDRICGGVFNSVLTDATGEQAVNVALFSYVRPFTLHFRTDATEENAMGDSEVDSGNRGFCLNFVQIPCTNNALG